MSNTRSSKNNFQRVPAGPLGLIAMQGSSELGALIDGRILDRRREFVAENPQHISFPGFLRDSYLVPVSSIRFATGEGKAVINETVRGHDIFILTDVGNYSCKYKMYGVEHPMSPDDHFQDLKRVISAIGGKARRLSVIMPMLYESRQHKRNSRESLDCALSLKELESLGVDNILTFDAHDPRVQNAIPLIGFENLHPTYQIIKALIANEPELMIDRKSMLVVSPDEGGIERCMYYSSMLGLDLAMFYKRRDYTRVVNGRNPIVRHEFLGDSVEGKDVLIVDDIISSGESIIDIAREMKKRKAGKVYIAVSFALFTEGIGVFQEAWEQGVITRLFATNLTYRSPELKNAPWYVDVDISKFIALLIDALNHDQSISSLIDPSEKISRLMKQRAQTR